MPLLYVVGNAVVLRDAIQEQLWSKREGEKRFKFTHGGFSGEEVSKLMLPDGQSVPFTPVGCNTPLTVRIERIYPGCHPSHEGKSMILTTAMKGIEVYDGSPRAVNLVRQAVTPKIDFPGPMATENGTRLVFYCAALPEDLTYSTLEIDMAFNNVAKDIVRIIETVLPKAAAIPAFAPAQMYLIAAGEVLKLADSVLQTLFPRQTAFKASYDFYFHEPGHPIEGAGFRIACSENLWRTIRSEGYTYNGGRLVKNDDPAQPYRGDEPYVVFSVDGAPNSAFSMFVPTAASADLLERFFGLDAGKSALSDQIVSALQLVNDVQYRKRAEAKHDELVKAEKDHSDKVEKIKKELQTLINAIQMKDLVPKWDGNNA